MKDTVRIILAGNPNVGKSTVFNALTGLKQHTGNWSGKTVELATGSFEYERCRFILQDLPGTYSLISNSPEEDVARDTICLGRSDFVLVVADATCLARNLNLLLQILEITPRVALCVNLLDEALRKNIIVDLNKLECRLGIPVIGISAKKRKDIARLKSFLKSLTEKDFPFQSPRHPVLYPSPLEDALQTIIDSLPQKGFQAFSKRFLALKYLDNEKSAAKLSETLFLSSDQQASIQNTVLSVQHTLYQQEISGIVLRDMVVEALVATAKEIADFCTEKVKKETPVRYSMDQILTSKWLGIPIMLGFLGILLWITISGANVPSTWLMDFFSWFKPKLFLFFSLLPLPQWLLLLLIDGIYQTIAWVTSVMLPPMLIFFPLFTLLEDLGYLPRLAFNLDRCFKRAGSCGKQALTMCKEKFKMFLQHNL